MRMGNKKFYSFTVQNLINREHKEEVGYDISVKIIYLEEITIWVTQKKITDI